MTDRPGQQPADDLTSLPFDELRDRAFRYAEHHADVGFFWDLFRHMPETAIVATEDGSPGEAAGGLLEAVATARQMFRRDLGDQLGDYDELFRARFVDYLRRHGQA